MCYVIYSLGNTIMLQFKKKQFSVTEQHKGKYTAMLFTTAKEIITDDTTRNSCY